MATGKLHVNGTTYTLTGEFSDRFNGAWQAVEDNVSLIGQRGGNFGVFTVLVHGQQVDLTVRAGAVATIAAWLEEDLPGAVVF